MKFLCIECDEAMKLTGTRGPDDGSMTVIFGCPQCGKEIAMLTNAMETQMVRSLDVKIGGRSVPAEPMETVKNSLASKREDLFAPSSQAPSASNESQKDARPESKCPFTGEVAAAFEKSAGGIVWTAEAEQRMERIPSFVRPMVKKSIEQHAQEKGIKEITAEVLEDVRQQLGM